MEGAVVILLLAVVVALPFLGVWFLLIGLGMGKALAGGIVIIVSIAAVIALALAGAAEEAKKNGK